MNPLQAIVFGSGMRLGYHIGVYTALVTRGEAFNAFLGSGMGSLIAAILAQYKFSELDRALVHLNRLLTLSTGEVWKSWPFGIVNGAWRPAALDSSPLRWLVHEHVEATRLRDSGNSLVVAAVDVMTGETRTFTQNDPDVVDGIVAACSTAGLFSPYTIRGATYWDVPTRDASPARLAVRAGADQMTVVMQTPHVRTQKSAPQTLVECLAQSTETASNELLYSDVALTDATSTMATLKLLRDKRPISLMRMLRPKWELTPTHCSPLLFEQKLATEYFKAGVQDGQRAIPHFTRVHDSNPPGTSWCEGCE